MPTWHRVKTPANTRPGGKPYGRALWRRVRKRHLASNPACSGCGRLATEVDHADGDPTKHDVYRLTLPDQDEAKAETGYARGAITPFGARRPWPVIADASIEGLDIVAIGGGAHGVNVHLAPDDLVRATGAEVVDITTPESPAPA